MHIKEISHKEEMYEKIKKGVDSIASIVARTLGPGGLPILIERQGQALNGDPLGPMITKDGVTVASECSSSDEKEDVVIQAVKAICQKTNRVAGDGTTTAIVLGRAILKEAFKLIEEQGLNPQEVRQSIELAATKIDTMLVEASIPCKDIDQMEHVATISANGDKEIGKVIRDAFEAVGAEGVVTVDEGGTRDHTLEVVNGFQFRRGAEAQDRFFNNETMTKFEAEKVNVLIYDGKLQQASDAIQILELIYKANNENLQPGLFGKMPPVVLIANEFGIEVIQLLLINRAESKISLCAVKGPNTTNVRTAMYDDLAVFLGGTRLGNGNRNLSNATMDDIGMADKVVIDKYTTTFYGGYGSDECVLERIDQLKAQRTQAESPYDASIISDRIAGLSEGVAKIGVGGATELEIKEKYHRIEDAVNASRAAIEQGIVPGGGSTLYRLSEKLRGDTVGEQVLKLALKAPFMQILDNLGINPSEEVLGKILQNKKSVYDGTSHKIVNSLKAGIIDPTKVTRTALSNAISIAALLSTCGGAITNHRK